MAQQNNFDRLSQRIGLSVFLLGIGLMLFVFFWAARLFGEVSVGKEMLLKSNPDNRAPLMTWLGHWIVRIALVFVLGYLASLIAARGIGLYLSAKAVKEQPKG